MDCQGCGKSQGFLEVLGEGLLLDRTNYYCDDCQLLRSREQQAREEKLRKRAESIVVTTTHNIDGWKVQKYLGIESVECVIGTGLFSEFSSGVSDFLGRRSSGFEKKLQTAKKGAFDAIKLLAAQKGGNAIVGVDIDYTEFSGNRIGLIVNGTVVQIVPSP
tara:strand:- start:9675 stop:10157 length:483 start_codon:yes stop_codon:yes gene_type:complete